ncbi:MAG TPA: hypothetical protein VGF90_05855, partial [Verrucomicrobiae bacterium]
MPAIYFPAPFRGGITGKRTEDIAPTELGILGALSGYKDFAPDGANDSLSFNRILSNLFIVAANALDFIYQTLPETGRLICHAAIHRSIVNPIFKATRH